MQRKLAIEMKKKSSSFTKAVQAAFPTTVPVLAGFLVLGVVYGILMSSKGYGPLWSLLFSAAAFCGSMQFVAIPFLTGTFAPLQVLLLSLMVNARHLFYGLSMLSKYKGAGKYKGFLIYSLCDETFAIISSAKVPDGIKKIDFYFAVSFLNMLYWALAGFLGGVLGNFLTINTTGLDFALTALFIVLFIEQLKSKKNIICGSIGILAALVSLLIFRADKLVIPSMVIILAALLAGRKQLCD